MPAEIVTLEDCASCFGVYDVEGSKGDQYVVQFHGETGVHCTCPGFKYRQDCKHVSSVYKTACMYNPQYNKGKEDPTIRPRDYTYDQFSKTPCPACGGPTVYVRRAV
jgi:hypothetical protein